MARSSLAQWVSQAAERIGGQAELARLVSKHLRRTLDRAAINKMTLASRMIRADEMLAIEEITGLPIPSANAILKIPLIDWVNAGSLSEPRSQVSIHDVPLLPFANLGHGEFFALAVTGNSMDRVSPEGSIIVVDRADRTLVNGRFYIFGLKGETTYKKWSGTEPEFLSPYSTDPSHGPIFVKHKRDIEVIGRVKRSMLEL